MLENLPCDGEFFAAAFADNGSSGTMEHLDKQPGYWRPSRLATKGIVMFGIGNSEMVILGLICLLTVVPGLVGLGVLIWLIVKRKSSGENMNAK